MKSSLAGSELFINDARLQHVHSLWTQVFKYPSNSSQILVKYENVLYTVNATLGSTKCFECGDFGHKCSSCLQRESGLAVVQVSNKFSAVAQVSSSRLWMVVPVSRLQALNADEQLAMGSNPNKWWVMQSAPHKLKKMLRVGEGPSQAVLVQRSTKARISPTVPGMLYAVAIEPLIKLTGKRSQGRPLQVK